MDNIVDALNNAYQEFLGAVATVFEAREVSGSQKTAATDAALENFKQRWELFRVACDQAEEFVETIKQRIGSECLVDEATGSMAGKPGQAIPPGLPPISAVRLEQMSKAVRWLVIELQQGSGAAGGSSHTHSTAPFDARFSDDATHCLMIVSSVHSPEVMHINLNDGTCVGLAFPAKNIMSLQYHPEASPGPHDSDAVFWEFVDMMKRVKENA